MDEQRKPKTGDCYTPHTHFTKALEYSFVPNFTQKVPVLPLCFFSKISFLLQYRNWIVLLQHLRRFVEMVT